MPWDIINDPADAAAQRSKIDSTDLDALVAGIAGTGVVSGGAVTVSSTTAVAVAAGVGMLGGAPGGWSAATPTITAAHSTLPRRDLVTVNSSGAVVVTAGAAAANPVEPAIPASSILLAVVDVLAGTSNRTQYISDRRVMLLAVPAEIGVALSDETTVLTSGVAKVTMRMPFALTVTSVRASLTTASSSGVPTFDINEGGVSILSTKLTIDATEKTSTTAATAAVLSDTALAADAEITFDVDVAGTGATGAKVWLLGTRA